MHTESRHAKTKFNSLSRTHILSGWPQELPAKMHEPVPRSKGHTRSSSAAGAGNTGLTCLGNLWASKAVRLETGTSCRELDDQSEAFAEGQGLPFNVSRASWTGVGSTPLKDRPCRWPSLLAAMPPQRPKRASSLRKPCGLRSHDLRRGWANALGRELQM